MKNNNKSKGSVSIESQTEALKIAKATQKPTQTKEQTKLIAQGIEKGITLYKKQQKEKAREADKLKKKTLRQKQNNETTSDIETKQAQQDQINSESNKTLPWILLALSWAGFIYYSVLGF
ncbi:DUF2956 domain-containing protein [uncultured Aliivibrio sp.]|uniref:DUF2956 domain-containing protein n=1 Tax=Aliivibrio salmonicida TaxID=40269 RepID=UPI002616E357|nr:DUF2956 domain-containing protein [uncultured Aliivibrio sp.]